MVRRERSRSCSERFGDSLGDGRLMVVCDGTLAMIWDGSWGGIGNWLGSSRVEVSKVELKNKKGRECGVGLAWNGSE